MTIKARISEANDPTNRRRTPRVAVRLTRRNLMLRDAHECQYCGKRPPLRDLNIDHVLPRSRGGVDSWENLVTSCRTSWPRASTPDLPAPLRCARVLTQPSAPSEPPAPRPMSVAAIKVP